MDYILEIKQLVDYPRCRIYREFIRDLMEDRNIRTNGNSYLFYYTVLCSYANFRSSYRKIEGISYHISPGEWVCKTSELNSWFRKRFQHQAISILEHLQKQNYITYSKLGRGNLIKFKITGWNNNNTALEYNYPCQKDTGFFFFPIAAVHELISMDKCSEMDIVLDLWIHAIYQDEQVKGSDVGPVVYFRNSTGDPVTNYNDLSKRWGISKATVSRVLKKLEEKEYLSLVSFVGTHGSIIYLCNYLSTMFNVSDVMIDKEEVSMTFQVQISLPDCVSDEEILDSREEKNSVSIEENSVSNSHIQVTLKKVSEILAAQGIPCCECSSSVYKLYRLSDCKGQYIYSLNISCPNSDTNYQFELSLTPVGKSSMHSGVNGSIECDIQKSNHMNRGVEYE